MKKQLYFSLFSLFVIATIQVDGADLVKDPGYAKVKRDVELLRERVMRRAMGGAATGAVVGASVGAAGMLGIGKERRREMFNRDPFSEDVVSYAKNPIGGLSIGATGGALAGAVAGAGLSEAKRRYIIWKINTMLRTTTVYDFTKMRMNDAIMVLAAYQRDLPTMQIVMPHVQRFLKKRGVWEALTLLYFGTSTPEHINRLKEALETAE